MRYKINIANSFAKAWYDEKALPMLADDIREKVSALNLDINSPTKAKLDIILKKLKKAKKYHSFYKAWKDFYAIAEEIKLLIIIEE